MNTNLSGQLNEIEHELLGPLPQTLIRQVLTTTDFSNESQAGTDYAMALAEKLGASVLVFHVIEPIPAIQGMEDFFPLLASPSTVATQARRELKRIAEKGKDRGLSVTSSLRSGKPFHCIASAAADLAADLVIMATHGYTGLDHALVGSTAERVVRHAPCSVLTVPARAGGAARPVEVRIAKILVPLDFSDLSRTALPWAAFFAETFGAEIVLLHVTETFPILIGGQIMNRVLAPVMQDAEASLQRIGQQLATAGVKATTAVREGVPYREICHAARELRVDVIALTTHGHSGLKRALLGSTAERVVRHARCPVLVVRNCKNRTS